MNDERRAAREAAAATLAARLVEKGYTAQELVTIAFVEGVAHGVEEAYAAMESVHSQVNSERAVLVCRDRDARCPTPDECATGCTYKGPPV